MSKMPVEKRIMVFGTFDGLHKGHLNFLKQAKSLVKKPLNSFLIVSIARDKNVTKIKGKAPVLSEKKRMKLLRDCSLVGKVVLSGIKNHIPHIVKEKPDIIALGYDQKAYIKNLKLDLKNKGVDVEIVRLKPYKEGIYKNHLLSKNRHD